MPGLYVRDTGGVARKYRELHEAQGGVDRKLREMYARDTQGVSRRVFAGAPRVTISHSVDDRAFSNFSNDGSYFIVTTDSSFKGTAYVEIKFSETVTVTDAYLYMYAFFTYNNPFWYFDDDILDFFNEEDVALRGCFNIYGSQSPYVTLTKNHTKSLSNSDSFVINKPVSAGKSIYIYINNRFYPHREVEVKFYAIINTKEFGRIRIPTDF